MAWLSRLAVCAVLLIGAPALGQSEDWGVKRNPFDARIVERWKAVVERDPNDAAAVKKLWELYVRYSKPDKLIAEYEAKLAAHESAKLALLLGHLYKLRPDAEKALQAYGRAAALDPSDPAPELALAQLHLAKQHKA